MAQAIYRGDGVTLEQIQAQGYATPRIVCPIPKYLIAGGPEGFDTVRRRYDKLEDCKLELAKLTAYYKEYYVQPHYLRIITCEDFRRHSVLDPGDEDGEGQQDPVGEGQHQEVQ